MTIVNLRFCKQMYDVTVTSHDLIFVIFFVELLVFLAKTFQNTTIVYLRT